MNYSDVFPPLNRSIPINNNINQYFVLPFGIDLNIEVSYLDLCAKYLSKVGIIVFGCCQVVSQTFQDVQPGHQDCHPDAWYERIQYLIHFQTSLSLNLSSFLQLFQSSWFLLSSSVGLHFTHSDSCLLWWVLFWTLMINCSENFFLKIYLRTQSC